MGFDSCREDIIEGYQCECGGSVTKNLDGKKWQCDTCNFEHEVSRSNGSANNCLNLKLRAG
jgi:hypothetical protein